MSSYWGRILVLAGLAMAVLIADPWLASGQVQTRDQWQCIERMNRDGRYVSSAQADQNRRCVRRAAKGGITDVQACLTADTRGDVAQEKQDTIDHEVDKCLSDPGQNPDFGKTDAATVNAAAVDEQIGFFGDLFGPSPNTAIIRCDTYHKGCICQLRVLKRAEDLLRVRLSEFRKCKRDGLDDGLITDAAGLGACMGQDPRGNIIKALSKLAARIDRRCTRRGVPQATAFPGTCAAGNLLGCVNALTACRTCRMLNDMDGLSANCDILDDGLANASCENPVHKCVLAPSPASEIRIHFAPLPVPLVFGVSGSLDIFADAGVADCGIQNASPISIPAIGYVCVGPGAACPPGVRHCGPGSGPPLGVDVQSDGDIGACTSNAACETACDAFCGGTGAVRLSSGCTGYCTGGDQSVCTTDAQCLVPPKGGACNGPDLFPPPSLANVCQCSCLNAAAHGASDPGDFRCNLGANITVESSPPCDGSDVLIGVGDICIPLTTQRATGLVTDANFMAGTLVPALPNTNDQSGVPVDCAIVDSSATTGIVGVGAVNAFGTVFGDLSIGLTATCQ